MTTVVCGQCQKPIPFNSMHEGHLKIEQLEADLTNAYRTLDEVQQILDSVTESDAPPPAAVYPGAPKRGKKT